LPTSQPPAASGGGRERWCPLRDRMTHKEQVERSLRVLQETCPLQRTHDPKVKRDVEAAVAWIAEQRAEHEEYDIKRKPVVRRQRRIIAGLRRARATAYSIEAAPTLDPLIDRLIVEASREQVWTEGEDRITILSGRNPKELAVELAYQLLRIHGAPSNRKGREELSAILPATTRKGAWYSLAAILYGDRKADLFQYVRKAAQKHRDQLRYFLPRKRPLTNI
jgi:hypothetical protein